MIKLITATLTALALCLPGFARGQAAVTETATVVAVVNGNKITGAKLQREIERQPALALLMKEAGSDPEKVKQARQQALDALIDRQLLIKAAQQNPAADEDKVRAYVDEVIKTYGGREPLAELLKDIGSDLRTFLEEISDDKRIQLFIEHEGADRIEPDEDEIKAEFEKHKARYRTKEQRTVGHILITVPPDANPAQVEEARKNSEQLYEAAVRPHADFEELARRHSQSPSAKKGSLLGSFRPGTLPPAIETIIFELKQDEISKPIRTQHGFQIFKLLDLIPARDAELSEAREAIAERLAIRKRKQFRQELAAKLRSKAKIKLL